MSLKGRVEDAFTCVQKATLQGVFKSVGKDVLMVRSRVCKRTCLRKRS